ncbi:ABC transporter ATP-binding protein [Pseudooceanicola sp. CBS1P-1]|uniref:ATP-binding cassette domain-containing protein n=1 Tax=Pseudooceanicola albus TaxID=2692189 RepID=A0A6L7G607_9RHOB|nr:MULTISPECIES: ABC transporter ATP-binding protein [Pseudooceanicola]MBT9386024.1 ABC transporter ATP-binding protein [Pseudooceanicola endophyticus]MXN19555.1 ATP-binding cassette domain-containing protein [Pseudooceanicola albus]
MSANAIEIRDLRKSFGPVDIIRGVNLELRAGERHALIGPNGAGKSTLFHLISGRLRPTSGKILLHGQEIQGKPPARIVHAGLSRSFQITNIFPEMTVLENLRCAVLWKLGHRYSVLRPLGRLRDVEAECTRLLEELRLTHRRTSRADSLSYPEQRALELGLAVASGADTLLLDEPMAGMSHSETAAALELIMAVTEGRSLLMVEHDMGVIFEMADRISVLVYGEVIATGTPEEIRANPAVQEAYLGTPNAEEAA